jgi:hypothetical protein
MTDPRSQPRQREAQQGGRYDVHGAVAIRVHPHSRDTARLHEALACFATAEQVRPDLVVGGPPEPVPDAGLLNNAVTYTENTVSLQTHGLQVSVDGNRFAIRGKGDVLAALRPVLDRAMVTKGVALCPAAAVEHEGRAVLLAGTTSDARAVAAALVQRPAWSFMGADWVFLAEDGRVLGWDVPPQTGSGPDPDPLDRPGWGRRASALVRGLHLPRRAAEGLEPFTGSRFATAAPLGVAVHLERFDGARAQQVERSSEWLVDRLVSSFPASLEAPGRAVLHALAATSTIPVRTLVNEKAQILDRALVGRRVHQLRIPSVYSTQDAAQIVLAFLDRRAVGVAGRDSVGRGAREVGGPAAPRPDRPDRRRPT